ncbi:MAG: DUF6171 family protein [Lachnospiraceae bacterium]
MMRSMRNGSRFVRSAKKLYQGMCRICGCYVELRAVMKKNGCPLVKPMWTRVQEENVAY